MGDIQNAFSMDWSSIAVDFLRVTIAFVLALPIAFQRFSDPGDDTGFRTFPIVAMASCGFLLIGRNIPTWDAESHARILQGLMAGIGFIGGGAILKESGSVRGLAIAASIWTTGAIGAAVAYGQLGVAIILSLINFALLRVLTLFRMKE